MNWRTLGTADAAEWRRTLGRFPRADVYFLPEYHRAYELNGDGKACAFVAEDAGGVLFHAFFVRPIEWVAGEPVPGAWCDLETVYGYSGPLCTTADPAFLDRAWAAFARWCRENRVVAEFIRFHPFLDNHGLAGGSCLVGLDRESVVIHLDCSDQELWDSYPSGQRTKVRQAQKSGLVCEPLPVAEGMGAFRDLYHRTMDRNAARDYYHFSEAYFDHLAGPLADSVRLFAARDRGRVVAAALFLAHREGLHYHLGGSDAACRAARPNNLLFHTAARWGREHGFRWLHLGGGRTADPGDALYRFKATLSPARRPFHTGRRVHDPEAYEGLCAEWARRGGARERPSYFLLYRLGGDHE